MIGLLSAEQRFSSIVGLALIVASLFTACAERGGTDSTPIPTVTTAASPSASPGVTETAAPATATNTAITSPDASPTGTTTTGDTPVYGYRIVNTYPHDPLAFTQGLDFADGVLFEGTGQLGESWLRRVELATGEVLQQADLPAEHFGEGVTVLGDRIYQITWRSQLAYVYNRETFEVLDTATYPTEGWGLTNDGERLIMSDGSSTIFFRDPATFAETRHVEVRDGDEPVNMLNELEWINGEVWANVWQTDLIVRIDPATGAVLGWIDLTGLLRPEDQAGANVDVLNGIALDETTGRLFVTGKYWPVMYEIEVVGP